MTRDEIIRMAREAGLQVVHFTSTPDSIERFAELVAAAEREQMQTDGWRQCAIGQKTTQFCGVLEQAVAAERERCAKVCEEQMRSYMSTQYTADPLGGFRERFAAEQCAAAIREMM